MVTTDSPPLSVVQHVGKLIAMNKILQALHIYYLLCWLHSKLSFTGLSNFFVCIGGTGTVGLSASAWYLNMFALYLRKDEGCLGLIDIATQGSILATKWVVRCLEGCSPWQLMLRRHLLMGQHISNIRGSFILHDIISTPHSFQVSISFIIISISPSWRKVVGLVWW
jgi:hypothetical protein